MPYKRVIDCSEVHLFEDPANGTNHIAIKAPEDLDAIGTIVLRPATAEVIETPYVVTAGDRAILVDDDAAGGPVVIELPPAADNDGRELVVKKIGATGNVTVTPDGADTIDNEPEQIIIFQFDAMQLHCDGAGWFII